MRWLKMHSCDQTDKSKIYMCVLVQFLKKTDKMETFLSTQIPVYAPQVGRAHPESQ